MRTRHQITVRRRTRPSPTLTRCCLTRAPRAPSGQSARVIGYSPTAAAILVVILVRREDRPGSWWGANGWRANSTGRRIYAEGTQRHE